jgi:hypothetical protein
MNNKLVSSLFMVCAITNSHANLPTKEEMVLILREESRTKLEAFQKIMPVLLNKSRVALGKMAYGYVVLADVMQFPEAQQLVGWPFMQFLCPQSPGRRFTEEGTYLQYITRDSAGGKCICYINSTDLTNLVSPIQPGIWYLSNGDLIDWDKKAWEIAAWSPVLGGEYLKYKKYSRDMGFLAEIYVELSAHPEEIGNFLASVSSAVESATFIAYPKDVKLLKEDGTLNELFFIEWHNNIREYFVSRERVLIQIIKELSPEDKEKVKEFFSSLSQNPDSGGTQNVGKVLLSFCEIGR